MQVAKDESGQILKVAGTLRIALAGELHRALRDFIDEARRPVVDLSEVAECDATAFQLLYSARKTADGAGKPFGLTGLSTAILDASAALGLQLTEFRQNAHLDAPEAVSTTNPAERGDEHAV
jgi:anti-anti-sigma regulatory factor